MNITTTTYVPNYLFKGWGAPNGGWAFFGLLTFTVLLCVVAEVVSNVMMTVKKAQGPSGDVTLHIFGMVLFVILRSVNYLQMLVVMTYNFWFILTLAITTGLIGFLSAQKTDKETLASLKKKRIQSELSQRLSQ